jgi:GR25 family glycosyltransferase involved in LPS biosynthesis
MIKKYYINMDKSKDRNEIMLKNHKDITRIEAYDGDKIDSYSNIILPKKTFQDKYQLCCSLSHLKTIFTSLKNGDSGAIIFEDDVIDIYSHLWEESINDIIKNAPKKTECIQLFPGNPELIKENIKSNLKYIKWHKKSHGTLCYYISNKGMKKLFNLFYKNNQIDLSIKLKNYVADNGIIYNNLKTYIYSKPLFINYVFSSTILKEGISKSYLRRSKIDDEIHNIIKHYFEK